MSEARIIQLTLRPVDGSSPVVPWVVTEGDLPIGKNEECVAAYAGSHAPQVSCLSRKHALVQRVDGEFLLTDLGSTNGTRLGAKKIDSVQLAHGDRFTLGAIKLVLEDASLAKTEEKAEALGQVSADQLARSRSGSKRGWILAVLMIAARIAGRSSKLSRPSAVKNDMVSSFTTPTTEIFTSPST